MQNIPTPDSNLALKIAQKYAGEIPTNIRRFQTGSGNYVFEVSFDHKAQVVVRIAPYKDTETVQGAVYLSKTLRPLGVPLPELLDEGVMDDFPYIILERLPGSDLAHSIEKLSLSQLEKIASSVAEAQRRVASLPTCGRYGYSLRAESAPYSTWSEVILENLERSRARILSAKIFDISVVERVEEVFHKVREKLDRVEATAFLHDTTTKNVLITEDGEFSGIVDVDDLCFGDPRYAPALTFAAILAFGGDTRYVDTWMEKAGFKMDSLFHFYVAVFLVDFMSEQGQHFNGNQKEANPQVCKKLEELLVSPTLLSLLPS